MPESPRAQATMVVALVALLAAIAVVLIVRHGASASPAATTSQVRSQFDGATMPPGVRAANFSLRDQNGLPITLSHDRGRVVVLTFIHSLCKDTCPFMVEQIKGALNALPGSGRNVTVIGVSVDPLQDTIRNRRWFLARHQMTGRMHFVSGPPATLRRIWHDYAIQPVSAHFDHSTFVMLIDKRGYERIGDPASQLTPESLAHDISVLERERA
ncbi:MAG: SCO family protein [Solirubrobacteraceae bacterium]